LSNVPIYTVLAKLAVSLNLKKIHIDVFSLLFQIQHFEKMVKEHFTCRAPCILDACEAYLGGDLVGHAHDKTYISEDGSKSCSTGFKIMLGKLLPKLATAFSEAGITGG
jgi:hypothetical protein